jgi:hypothetical protein
MQQLRIVTVLLIAASGTIRADEPSGNAANLRRALEKPAPVLTMTARNAGVVAVYRNGLTPFPVYRNGLTPFPVYRNGLTPFLVVVEARRASRQAGQPAERSDSIWEGLLIGAAAGGVGGYIWARQICGGTDDTECFLISAPVGIAGGVGIGALAGAVIDKLHK